MIATVLMPAYNASLHIQEAIDSLLNQTLQNFKILIINDGSSDNTEEIINSYTDERIEYIKNSANLGLIKTLNLGFSMVQTKYLVRMDADDISQSTRLEKLVEFMETNEDIDICGSGFRSFVNDCSNIIDYKIHPTSHAEIKVNLLSYCALAHCTAIFRLNSWRNAGLYYPADYKHAEDYKMLTTAVLKLKLHNLPDILYSYRLHSNQVSSIYSNFQQEMSDKIRLEYAESVGVKVKPIEKDIYLRFIKAQGIINYKDFAKVKIYCNQLIYGGYFNSKLLISKLNQLYHTNVQQYFIRKRYSPTVLSELFKRPEYIIRYLSFRDILSLIFKAITFHKP